MAKSTILPPDLRTRFIEVLDCSGQLNAGEQPNITQVNDLAGDGATFAIHYRLGKNGQVVHARRLENFWTISYRPLAADLLANILDQLRQEPFEDGGEEFSLAQLRISHLLWPQEVPAGA